MLAFICVGLMCVGQFYLAFLVFLLIAAQEGFKATKKN
jgi:hypothetical protein